MKGYRLTYFLLVLVCTVHAQDMQQRFRNEMKQVYTAAGKTKSLAFEAATTFYQNDEEQADAAQRWEVCVQGDRTYIRIGATERVRTGGYLLLVDHDAQLLAVNKTLGFQEANPLDDALNDTILNNCTNVEIHEQSPDEWSYEMDITGYRFHHIQLFVDPRSWQITRAVYHFFEYAGGSPCRIDIRYTYHEFSEADKKHLALDEYIQVVSGKRKKDRPHLYPVNRFKSYQFINYLT